MKTTLSLLGKTTLLVLIVFAASAASVFADNYYYRAFNGDFAAKGSWKNSSNVSPTTFQLSDRFILDRGTDSTNATARLIGVVSFGGTLYAGFQDDARNGTITLADTTARLCTKGNSVVDTVTFAKMFMGNLRLNQWTSNTNSAPYWAVFKGNFVMGDGTDAVAGNILFDARANEGGSAGKRNLVLDSDLTGHGTFFMANVTNGYGVTLAGSNTNLGRVDWTVRQGMLTVGSETNTTLGLTANASRLGTNSTVTFNSSAPIPQDNTNSVDFLSSAGNNTHLPSLVFNTPTGQTSDNSTVTVSTVSGTNSTLTKNGAGTVLLGDTNVSTLNLRGGSTVFGSASNPVEISVGTLSAGVYSQAEATAGVPVSSTTIFGNVVASDLDIGVNNRFGTAGSTTTTFTVKGDTFSVNGPANTLSWACKTFEINGTDMQPNDQTVIDLSGVQNVSLTASALDIANTAGNGHWNCGANVNLGVNNTINVSKFRFGNSDDSAGHYDENMLFLGQGTNVIQADSILWGGYRCSGPGVAVSVRTGDAGAKTGTVSISGRNGGKANLTIGSLPGWTAVTCKSLVDLTNAASAVLNLDTLTLAHVNNGVDGTFGAQLLLGENVSLSANKIVLGDNTAKSTATLSIGSGTVDLYGPVVSAGKSTLKMNDGTINIHIQDLDQLETALITANSVQFSTDVQIDLAFDESINLIDAAEFTVLETSEASLQALSDAADGIMSTYFTELTNYYFNIQPISDGKLILSVNGGAVPEPASWLLLLCGGLGVLMTVTLNKKRISGENHA